MARSAGGRELRHAQTVELDDLDAVGVGDVDLVPVDGGENYVFITRFSEEQLEERESVDEGWWQ